MAQERTNRCAPFPAVTMATATGRGILNTRGRYGQRSMVLPALPTPVPHLTVTHTHTHTHPRRETQIPCPHREWHMCHTGKQNEIKMDTQTCAVKHKLRAQTPSSAPDICPLAANTAPSHFLSLLFLLLTYCLRQTKRHIPPGHQLIDYGRCRAKMIYI